MNGWQSKVRERERLTESMQRGQMSSEEALQRSEIQGRQRQGRKATQVKEQPEQRSRAGEYDMGWPRSVGERQEN